MIKLFNARLLLFSFHVSYSINSLEVIDALCKRYERDITVLEIGSVNHAYVFGLAKRYSGTYIIMDRKFPYRSDALEELRYKNIVFLHPYIVDSAVIYNLGKCEHFDVVIVRELPEWSCDHTSDILQALLTLGDHIFFEVSESVVDQVQTLHSCEIASVTGGKMLAYCEVHKKGIVKPRWTSNEETHGNYGIVSTFTEKKMDKQSTGTTSHWIPGLNLLTFLALKGVYPTDKMMRKQLKTFKHINHNDLVLGNIVVQGRTITPIDFHDKRRNVDPAICVKAALKKVIRDGRLKQDPETMLRKYSEYLQRHKRRMKS